MLFINAPLGCQNGLAVEHIRQLLPFALTIPSQVCMHRQCALERPHGRAYWEFDGLSIQDLPRHVLEKLAMLWRLRQNVMWERILKGQRKKLRIQHLLCSQHHMKSNKV